MAHIGIHHDVASTGLLPKAASLTAKYAERDDEGNIRYTTAAIENIGVHWGNRGGVYTQGQRCRSLFETVMMAGFSKEEANTRGIAVRERKAEEMGTAYGTYGAFSVRKSSEDELLNGAFGGKPGGWHSLPHLVYSFGTSSSHALAATCSHIVD